MPIESFLKLKNYFVALFTWCVLASSTVALAGPVLVKPPPAKQARIDELFKILDLNHEIDKSWSRIEMKIRKDLIKSNYAKLSKTKLTGQEKFEKATSQAAIVITSLNKDYSARYKSEMRKIYVHVYSKYYTEADLKTLITFYNSKAGKKAMQKNPQIIKSTTIKMVRKMRPRLEKHLKDKFLGEAVGD